MARVLVTGSADGLGLAVGQRLIAAGHEVVLHARSDARATDTHAAAPGVAEVLVGDLASDRETRALADAANASGRFDAVIHNAGVGYGSSAGSGSTVLAVNVVAPYLLTALMTPPDRLVYLSSGMHRGGRADLAALDRVSYSDSKLLDAALAAGVARRWPEVRSNAVDPGWIRTRMGGRSAPGSLEEGSATQVWLATSDDPAALVSGRYFVALREQRPARGDGRGVPGRRARRARAAHGRPPPARWSRDGRGAPSSTGGVGERPLTPLVEERRPRRVSRPLRTRS